MKKWIRRIIMTLLLAVFVCSCSVIAFTYWQYEEAKELYSGLSEQYTFLAKESPQNDAGDAETAPIVVDFESLKKINDDIIGWIYCEDTVIDYPILQGEDNDYYLHHSFEKEYSNSGSIFLEAANHADFSDSNHILYGHHMKNKTMFATLSNWSSQEYYEAHPVMWILTPERDYKVELFSAYTTSASSDTYQIFENPGESFSNYLKNVAAQSNFKTDLELEEDGHYVLLSTCAYVFDNARDVLHGKLTAVDSAGGILKMGD